MDRCARAASTGGPSGPSEERAQQGARCGARVRHSMHGSAQHSVYRFTPWQPGRPWPPRLRSRPRCHYRQRRRCSCGLREAEGGGAVGGGMVRLGTGQLGQCGGGARQLGGGQPDTHICAGPPCTHCSWQAHSAQRTERSSSSSGADCKSRSPTPSRRSMRDRCLGLMASPS